MAKVVRFVPGGGAAVEESGLSVECQEASGTSGGGE